jgi:tetratricopeptide (TPR) repeat protein
MGQMYLLQRQFDKAIEHLEQAKRADPNDVSIYADLGAAYLEKGKLDNNQDVFRLSLENLNPALVLKPDLREALFNRALLYQSQGMNDQAGSDWRSYL